MAERPTKSWILAELERRRGSFNKMHRDMLRAQDYYHWPSLTGSTAQNLGLSGLPKDFKPKLPPIAKIGTDLAVNHLIVGDIPGLSVSYPKTAQHEATQQAKTEAVVNFCRAILYNIFTFRTETPLRDFITKGFALGLGVLAYPFIQSRWPAHPLKRSNGVIGKPRNAKEREAVEKWEENRRKAFPWDIRSVHPATLFFDPFHDPPRDYIEEQTIAGALAHSLYPDLSIMPGDMSGGVKRVIYCSDEWYAVYVAGQPVLTEGADSEGVAENPRKRAWYRMAWAGYGDTDEIGRWERKGKGMIIDAIPLINMYTVNMNVLEVIRSVTAFPPMDISGATKEEATRESDDLNYGIGVRWTHANTVQAHPLAQIEVTPALFQENQLVLALLELWWGPDILRGRHTTDTASGLRIRMSQAMAIYRSMKQNAEQAIAAMLTDILWTIKHELREDVTVWAATGNLPSAATIRPDDIQDDMRITVNLTPPTEEEKQFLLQEGHTRLQAGTLDMLTFLEKYALEDHPTDRMKAIFKDRLLRNPLVENGLAQILTNIVTEELPEVAGQVKAEQAAKGNLPTIEPRITQNGTGQAGMGSPGERTPPPNLNGQNAMAGMGQGMEKPPPMIMGPTQR